jgi:hypothetical protein
VILGALAFAPAASAQVPPECPWMDTTKSPGERAHLLLAASSLDQKLRWLDEQSANNPAQTVFSIGGGQTATMPPQVPCTPVIQYTDAPTAIVGAGTGVTAFPSQTALSATWDEDLARRKGQAQGYEAFHKHRNVALAPGLASGRTPLSGRTSEYLGEDPLLAGTLAASVIHGFGENPNEPVESVLKHYVANEQEIDRQTSSSNVDQRTLREIYTLPFEVAIKKGRPGGVMCSYNQVNGVYACENANTLDRSSGRRSASTVGSSPTSARATRSTRHPPRSRPASTRSSTAGASGRPTCSSRRSSPAASPRPRSTRPRSASCARTSRPACSTSRCLPLPRRSSRRPSTRRSRARRPRRARCCSRTTARSR